MKKVLILEPDEAMRKLYQEQLKDKIQITREFWFEEFSKKILDANQNFDAIVLTSSAIAKMPSDFLRGIKESFCGPIIGTSGFDQYQKELRQLGCAHVCQKSQLARLLQEILEI